MNIKVQLLSLFISFIYGCIYNLLSKYNKKLIVKKHILIQIVITALFVINNVLIYLIILYKTNYGQFHIYFLAMIALGFMFSQLICKNYVKKKKYYWYIFFFSLSLL